MKNRSHHLRDTTGDALRNNKNGGLTNGTVSLLRNQQVGESFLWACNGKGTSDVILTWHIATAILKVRHPYVADEEQGSGSLPLSDYEITATQLSQYCIYLMTHSPELLPDHDGWSKSLYEAVKKHAEVVVAGHLATGSSLTPEAEYHQLIQLLSADTMNEILNNGARLGKQLVELEGVGTAWKLLADFWSEMILFATPSDNLKGHAEAIARGGELITLLWVLLFHAGIVNRPGNEGRDTNAAGAV